MSRQSKRAKFYARRKLERFARQRGGFVCTRFSLTDSRGRTVHLGPGAILKQWITP